MRRGFFVATALLTAVVLIRPGPAGALPPRVAAGACVVQGSQVYQPGLPLAGLGTTPTAMALTLTCAGLPTGTWTLAAPAAGTTTGSCAAETGSLALTGTEPGGGPTTASVGWVRAGAYMLMGVSIAGLGNGFTVEGHTVWAPSNPLDCAGTGVVTASFAGAALFAGS